MNDKQLDIVLDYLNEGIAIDMDEYLSEGADKKVNKDIQKQAANAVNAYIASEGFGDCTFHPTYSMLQTGLFNRSEKSKAFTKGTSNQFVLTAQPKMAGYGAGSYSGSNGSGSAYDVNYSMEGIAKVGKFLKGHISDLTKEVSDRIGPCRVKVGDLYHDNQYITLVITMK